MASLSHHSYKNVPLTAVRYKNDEVFYQPMRRPKLDDLKKTLESFTKFVEEPFEMPKKMTKKFVSRIQRRFRYLIYALDTSLKKKAIDRMFYSFEYLPPTGKEFWFLLFMPDERAKARQLFSAFGRANTYGLQTNGIEMKRSVKRGGKYGVQNTFFYDKKLKTLSTDETRIKLGKNIVSTTGNTRVEVTGNFPKYRYKLLKGDEVIADFKTSKHRAGRRTKCNPYFKGPFGYACLNILLNYKGKLNGKEVSGTCDLQKVVLVGPFIPWKWGRITFKNKSEFEYWCIQTPTPGYQYKLLIFADFFDAKTKKNHHFEDVHIRNFGNKQDYWMIEARNKDSEIVTLLKSYGKETFLFSMGSSFEYTPNFAEVKSFDINGLPGYSAKELGSAVGFLEETRGIVF